ncbi:hypothetical protein CHELA1G11_12434 [Hyphomicrobiales bacterium]|nr:hypothetical protein CHELA1G2_11873 [Hyphomicrobiales bacterium]CAH1664808.1 hypothetical protein CHELA1G11_12434 [Hyphomicrobiales bacterium]
MFSTDLFRVGQTNVDVGNGDMILVNSGGGLDAWFDYGLDGRRIEIKQLASVSSPFSSAMTVFKAPIEAIDTGDAWNSAVGCSQTPRSAGCRSRCSIARHRGLVLTLASIAIRRSLSCSTATRWSSARDAARWRPVATKLSAMSSA